MLYFSTDANCANLKMPFNFQFQIVDVSVVVVLAINSDPLNNPVYRCEFINSRLLYCIVVHSGDAFPNGGPGMVVSMCQN